MSTIRRTSAIYNANLAAIIALQPEHALQFRALTEGLTSSAIALLHRDLLHDTAFDSVEDVQAAWSSIESNLPWERALTDATYGNFSNIASQIEDLDQHIGDEVGAAIASIHHDVLAAMESAETEMKSVEQRAIAQTIDLALNDLGYYVERAEIEGVVTGFEASKGDSKLVIEVTGGGVVTDFVGLADTDSCGTAQDALVDRVGTYGVTLDEQDRHDHRDTRGGGLVQRAARASGRTLAERIVSAYGTPPATRNLSKQLRTTKATQKASA